MTDVLEEYRRLKGLASEADLEVTRAEERLAGALESARSAAEDAKSAGFDSLADVQARRSSLEQQVQESLDKLGREIT